MPYEESIRVPLIIRGQAELRPHGLGPLDGRAGAARLDRLPLSRPHYVLLLIGGLGYTFDGLCVVVFGLSTAGRSLEDLTEQGKPALTTRKMMK